MCYHERANRYGFVKFGRHIHTYDFIRALIQPCCSLINIVFHTQALQVLAGLVEARTLPVSRYIEVTELTQGRLYDKLSNVRKYAMQLMITLISHNPYGAKVSVVYNTVHSVVSDS